MEGTKEEAGGRQAFSAVAECTCGGGGGAFHLPLGSTLFYFWTMLQLKEKELPFLESFTGDKYTSFFFLFSRIDTRPIVQKSFNILFDLREKQALWKKSAYGENFASYQRIGARWYDPEIGMWTTPDPLDEFYNPYSYVGGDPVNYIDYAGLEGEYVQVLPERRTTYTPTDVSGVTKLFIGINQQLQPDFSYSFSLISTYFDFAKELSLFIKEFSDLAEITAETETEVKVIQTHRLRYGKGTSETPTWDDVYPFGFSGWYGGTRYVGGLPVGHLGLEQEGLGILVGGVFAGFSNFAIKGSKGFNPFKGKTPKQIENMFKKKGFKPRGPDPLGGKGGYVNPKTGRSYHIDPGGKWKSVPEPPHVDVNRLKGSKLPKRKFFH